MNLQLYHTLESLISKNTHDDCSIAILSRSSGILCPYEKLSFSEKCDLFNIKSNKSSKKRVIWYDAVLQSLMSPKSVQQISHKFYIDKKYIKKRIKSLVLSGLIESDGMLYYRS
jgi:predicted ArsR family transcriptional regulator